MDSERIFNFRFLVPPSFLIFFVFLFSPLSFLELAKFWSTSPWLVGVVGTAGLLSLGFLISSITSFFVNKFMDTIEPSCAKYHKRLFHLEEFSDKKNRTALELGSWMVLDKIDIGAGNNSHIISQIHKRWNMAMANFNCVTAVISSLVLICFLLATKAYSLPDNCYGLILYSIIVLVSLSVFCFNGNKAHRSVLSMDLLLAKLSQRGCDLDGSKVDQN